jgi:hypothetical protein
VLPTDAAEYEAGYSIDRLRDLTLVDLSTPQSLEGTHLYESLAVLFRLIDEGFTPESGQEQAIEGLTFRSLRADLFRPEATELIDEVGLGNEAVQRVLQRLLLSKKSATRDRGFISYAELGINQLGAVYEGLMSYSGFFAEEDLYEVAKNGDAAKGSWVVPVERAGGIAEDDFVRTTDPVTGEATPVLHRRGTFVYRLAGRERQQSASYYTPEVLTRFVVSQALEELLDQDGEQTSAEAILRLTICEPALGSGAFAIEAVRQLAEHYLERRQKEVGERIDPDEYPRELQRVKAYIALHQTYGVDLNATAVELAEISLWLDTMVEGLEAPWFGLHLRRGNSLIGALKAVYSREQVASKEWLKATPQRVGQGEDDREQISGAIPHFLLPAEGWGAAAEVEKSIRELVPDEVKNLKEWRRKARAKPTKKQVDSLIDMSRRVERLWTLAARRLEIAESQIRRDIPVWKLQKVPLTASPSERPVSREEIEASLADPNGAYQRLRRVMDAWCALWFWPLTEVDVMPPSNEEWYDALQGLLGLDKHKSAKNEQQMQLTDGVGWDELGALEELEWASSGARDVAEVLADQPWLAVCGRIGREQGFFHWELEFSSVFTSGGFDLQVGNPPWVRPRSDQGALLAEGDPWWQLASKPTQSEKTERRAKTLEVDGIKRLLVEGVTEITVVSQALSWAGAYPALAGLQPDTYRCFMQLVWRHGAPNGVSALIHPETHFTGANDASLREATYVRIRRHWQFINELQLFDEVSHLKTYGVHIYGQPGQVRFQASSFLYHPETLERSLAHDGSGPEPGIRDDEGHWDLRPHRNRIIHVDGKSLTRWRDLLEHADVPVLQTKTIYPVNRAIANALGVLAEHDRVESLGLEFSRGWDETIDREAGFLETEWGRPDNWADVILQGPHFHVNTPFNKSPNPGMQSNQDWTRVDLDELPPDAIPITSFKPRGDRKAYDEAYTHWGLEKLVSPRDRARVGWRKMASNNGVRTLIPALIPPGAAHVNGVLSAGFMSNGRSRDLAFLQGYLSSMIADLLIRVVPKSNIYGTTVSALPLPPIGNAIADHVAARAAYLNCLTATFSDLWQEIMETITEPVVWTGGLDYPNRPALGAAGPVWTADSPIRRASDRRQAQLEIDAAVAVSLGLDADTLCTIYRTAFPVLYAYDQQTYVYDANGHLVTTDVARAWRQSAVALSNEQRTATNPIGNTYTYELPFQALDREADMRRAYEYFENMVAEEGSGG